jgi:hypothetical protein
LCGGGVGGVVRGETRPAVRAKRGSKTESGTFDFGPLFSDVSEEK